MGRKEDIEARMRALEAERAQLDCYGEDIYDDGDVIKFVKSFRVVHRGERKTYEPAERDFTYVALKAGGKWYMTGRRDHEGRGSSWDSLVEFMYAGIPVDGITIVIAEDFRTRDELERELAQLAAKSLPPIELPELSVRRGGVQFPMRYRGVTGYVETDGSVTSIGQHSQRDSVDPGDTSEPVQADNNGGWCAPSQADVNLVAAEDERNPEPRVSTPVTNPNDKNNDH